MEKGRSETACRGWIGNGATNGQGFPENCRMIHMLLGNVILLQMTLP
jgi:hypothetical protein